MTSVTITEPVQGEKDDGHTILDIDHKPFEVVPNAPFTVQPGVYEVEQVDDGDLWLIVDEVPDVCVIVAAKALGLVECNECDGRGEHYYRVADDDWETDECGGCVGLGAVKPDVATKQEADRERMLDEAYRHG